MEKPTFTSNFDPQKQTTIADVPSDALDEIFIRLPIPDLQASRLVSRYWNSRIADQQFIEKVKLHHATHAKVCIHDMDYPGDVMVLKINDEYEFSTENVAALLYVHPVLPKDAPYILGTKILYTVCN